MNRNRMRRMRHLADRVATPVADAPIETDYSWARPPVSGYAGCVMYDESAQAALFVGRYLPESPNVGGERIELEEAGLYAHVFTGIETPEQIRNIAIHAQVKLNCVGCVGEGDFRIPEKLKGFYGRDAEPHAFEILKPCNGAHPQRERIIADIERKVKPYIRRH
ncbi:MAG: hypothetical protein KKE05_02430 [Nanoarchaeota archaeon]|nr:hypothetical protein [Nanoarchaeota archaeon]